MLKITEILMDYEKEQTGMDHIPQFGWKLKVMDGILYRKHTS